MFLGEQYYVEIGLETGLFQLMLLKSSFNSYSLNLDIDVFQLSSSAVNCNCHSIRIFLVNVSGNLELTFYHKILELKIYRA